MRKLKKLCKAPGLFFRDYLNKRYPVTPNEIACPQEEENILLKHDLALESLLDNHLDIDVVFTWVDGSDPKWQKKYQKILCDYEQDRLGLYAADSARFQNNGELNYSLHSVLTYMPWIRKIYIITDQQCPYWLTPDKRIQLIDHQDLIKPCYLPTFNSHVIEAHLHNIPGISEHFIYFNDDFFVARPLPAGHFFAGNGIASLFLARKSLQSMLKHNSSMPSLLASQHSAQLLHAYCGLKIDIPLVHSYVPLIKSAYQTAWRQFNHEINHFLVNRFRGKRDLNLATFLVPWLMYAKGQAIPARDICYYFNAASPAAARYWQALEKSKHTQASPHSFCVNEQHYSQRHNNIASTLAKYYSAKKL